MKLQIYVELTVKYRRATGLYKLFWMGEHGISWENIENKENMDKIENINRMT